MKQLLLDAARPRLHAIQKCREHFLPLWKLPAVLALACPKEPLQRQAGGCGVGMRPRNLQLDCDVLLNLSVLALETNASGLKRAR
ncbi:hypothetical protein D3C72_1979000 [compost metagenome]